MADAVTLREGLLLGRDQSAHPWHVVSVVQLDGPISLADLEVRIAERLSYAPRFRRRLSGGSQPSWVDDPGMRLAAHLRHHQLGAGESFEEWLAGELSRPIDRLHPLWDATVVDGVGGEHTAVVFRCHPALVDGDENVHLVQELLDDHPEPIVGPAPVWQPAEEPSGSAAGVAGLLADPIRALRGAATGLASLAASGLLGHSSGSGRRWVAGVEVSFDQVQAARDRVTASTHDILLALATAGVREHLASSGGLTDPVALVPLGVEDEDFVSAVGCVVAPQWIVLPVTSSDPAERLATLMLLTQARVDSNRLVPARDLAELAGFAPPTLHALAAGTVSAGRPHTVLVANAPGPRTVRFLGERQVVGVHHLDGLVDDQRISIAITSYGDRFSFTATASAPLNGFAAAVAGELGRLGGAS